MYRDIYKDQNSITIDRQQQRDLHNARCYFESAIERCNDERLIGTLQKALDVFKSAHDPIRTEENARFDARFEHYETKRKQYKFKSVWSIFEVPDVEYEVTPDLVDITHVKYYNQLVAVEKGNGQLTWVDLWRAANEAIIASGDLNHVYVEAFYQRAEDPKGVYQLVTGS